MMTGKQQPLIFLMTGLLETGETVALFADEDEPRQDLFIVEGMIELLYQLAFVLDQNQLIVNHVQLELVTMEHT
jgi:hypothetical protein